MNMLIRVLNLMGLKVMYSMQDVLGLGDTYPCQKKRFQNKTEKKFNLKQTK